MCRRVALALVLALVCSARVRGQSVPLDSAHVARFVAEFMGGLHGDDSVARAAVVVVTSHGVLLSRGFGLAGRGVSVDPALTVFRAASNSKLFATATALQLREERRWQLTDDVNKYLPQQSRLAEKFDRPVTIADLLTHTAGLEAKFQGSVSAPAHRLSLADYFARNVPFRAVEPGREIAYSNTGMALAGYLVERATGVSFDEYADAHIFRPLGMTRSSFRQPPPAEWTGAVPETRSVRNVVFNPYPAASLVTTPDDMGRFIQALLGRGANSSGRMFDSATADMMLATHWRAQPDAPGAAYGFFEGVHAGHRYVFHTGDSGDHSVILLLPDRDVGFYFVYAGRDEQSAVRERFAAGFLRQFLGADNVPAVFRRANSQPGRFSGTYRTASYSRTNYEKVKAMLAEVRVSDGDDGSLLIQPPGGSRVRLRPVSELTFHGDSGEVVAFQADASGLRFTVAGSIWDPASWDRVPWYDRGRFHLALFALWFLVVLGRAIVLPLGIWVVERRRQTAPRVVVDSVRGWWRLTGIASWLIVLAPLVGFARAMTSFAHPAEAIPLGVGAGSAAMLLGTGVALVGAAVILARRAPGRTLNIASGVLLATSTLGLGLLAYWRILPL